jgi:hypothetical protein
MLIMIFFLFSLRRKKESEETSKDTIKGQLKKAQKEATQKQHVIFFSIALHNISFFFFF